MEPKTKTCVALALLKPRPCGTCLEGAWILSAWDTNRKPRPKQGRRVFNDSTAFSRVQTEVEEKLLSFFRASCLSNHIFCSWSNQAQVTRLPAPNKTKWGSQSLDTEIPPLPQKNLPGLWAPDPPRPPRTNHPEEKIAGGASSKPSSLLGSAKEA